MLKDTICILDNASEATLVVSTVGSDIVKGFICLRKDTIVKVDLSYKPSHLSSTYRIFTEKESFILNQLSSLGNFLFLLQKELERCMLEPNFKKLQFRIETCRKYIFGIISCADGYEGAEMKAFKPPDCPSEVMVGFSVKNSSIDVSILAAGNAKGSKKITGSFGEVVVKVETPIPLLGLIKLQIQKIDSEFRNLSALLG